MRALSAVLAAGICTITQTDAFIASPASTRAHQILKSSNSPFVDADFSPGASSTATSSTTYTDNASDNTSGYKNELLGLQLSTSFQKRTAVNELILKLESMNPTENPAGSAELNGVWEILFTGGLSPGMLAVQLLSKAAKVLSAVLDLKSVTLTIKRDQPRTEAAVTVRVLGREGTLKVRTRLLVETDTRISETYEEAEFAGVRLPLPAFLQMKRTLFITYLDDDIIIARDNSGSPDLLVRKAKDFVSYEGVPSYTDSDWAPGSG